MKAKNCGIRFFIMLLVVTEGAFAADGTVSDAIKSVEKINQINSQKNDINCATDDNTVKPSKQIKTDVLYSWQTLPAILEWASVGPTSQLFQDNYLYAWRTPAATFAYGDVPIRIKLKQGVRFKPIPDDQRNCANFPAQERENTVYTSTVAIGGGFTDYILCSQKVMTSWSFGTEQTLQEVQKDLNYAIAHPGQSDSYGSYDPTKPDEPFGRMDSDDSNWKVGELEKKIELLSYLAKTSLPRVYCMDQSSDCDKDHFTTSYPTYFRSAKTAGQIQYSGDPFTIKNQKTTVYIEDSAILNDGTLHLATLFLEHQPSLSAVIVSDSKRDELISKTLPKFRADMAALLKNTKVISTGSFKELSSKSTDKLLVIAADDRLKSGNAINFGRLSKQDLADNYEENGKGRNFIAMQILKTSQALLIDKLTSRSVDTPLLEYMSRLPLGQSFKESDFVYYKNINGSCKRVFVFKPKVDPAEMSPKLCELHQ